MNTRRCDPAASAWPAAFSALPGLPASSMAWVHRKSPAYSWTANGLATNAEGVRLECRLRRDLLGHASGNFWPGLAFAIRRTSPDSQAPGARRGTLPKGDQLPEF